MNNQKSKILSQRQVIASFVLVLVVYAANVYFLTKYSVLSDLPLFGSPIMQTLFALGAGLITSFMEFVMLGLAVMGVILSGLLGWTGMFLLYAIGLAIFGKSQTAKNEAQHAFAWLPLIEPN